MAKGDGGGASIVSTQEQAGPAGCLAETVGADILAEELGKTNDVHAAFAAYERRVRPFVEDKQRKARRFAQTFVSGSRLGVRVSYLMMRLMFTPLLARFIGKQCGFDSLLQPR